MRGGAATHLQVATSRVNMCVCVCVCAFAFVCSHKYRERARKDRTSSMTRALPKRRAAWGQRAIAYMAPTTHERI
jgi:hypothetical protein